MLSISLNDSVKGYFLCHSVNFKPYQLLLSLSERSYKIFLLENHKYHFRRLLKQHSEHGIQNSSKSNVEARRGVSNALGV